MTSRIFKLKRKLSYEGSKWRSQRTRHFEPSYGNFRFIFKILKPILNSRTGCQDFKMSHLIQTDVTPTSLAWTLHIQGQWFKNDWNEFMFHENFHFIFHDFSEFVVHVYFIFHDFSDFVVHGYFMKFMNEPAMNSQEYSKSLILSQSATFLTQLLTWLLRFSGLENSKMK